MSIQIIRNAPRPVKLSKHKFALALASLTAKDCIRVDSLDEATRFYKPAKTRGIGVSIIKQQGFYEVWLGAHKFKRARRQFLTAEEWKG